MPRVSQRQIQLRAVKQKLELNIALLSDSDESDEGEKVFHKMPGQLKCAGIGNFSNELSDDSCLQLDSSGDSDHDEYDQDDTRPEDLLELYFVLYNTRYFMPRHVSLKSNDFATQFFHNLPELLFRQLTRMNKNSFFHLLDLVSTHPVFQNRSQFEQAPIVRQMAVCLDRLGHDGNGACLNHMIPTWGVSTGSLVNFSKRCFCALESVLADQIQWPTRDERLQLSDGFARLGFPGCIGLIDGSLLPLAQRPALHGECYYDRKSRYSVNAQVVCDNRRKILFMFTGMPGSCSDLTCVKRSPLFQYCNGVGGTLLFDENQYLLGDSGYQALPHLVCAFKRSDFCQDKEDFNTCIAKCRVTNEHCIGVLKSRWHSLKEVRTQLNKSKDSLWMIRWVSLCGKLHNYVMSMNDEWSESDMEEDNCDEPPAVVEEADIVPDPARSSRRRTAEAGHAILLRVMDDALTFYRQPGGFLHHD